MTTEQTSHHDAIVAAIDEAIGIPELTDYYGNEAGFDEYEMGLIPYWVNVGSSAVWLNRQHGVIHRVPIANRSTSSVVAAVKALLTPELVEDIRTAYYVTEATHSIDESLEQIRKRAQHIKLGTNVTGVSDVDYLRSLASLLRSVVDGTTITQEKCP